MSPLDALWHLLNLFGPAVGVGMIAAGLAKALWRAELRSVPWRRLAQAAVATGMLVTLAGLVLFGQDGRMATYAALVVGCAASLGWVGFFRR